VPGKRLILLILNPHKQCAPKFRNLSPMTLLLRVGQRSARSSSTLLPGVMLVR